MRRQYLVFACIAVAAVTGCGGEDPPRAQKAPTPVALRISSPADMATVRDETVEVKGTVEPAGAVVLVLGQKAPVSGGGTFTLTVALEPGANVIDLGGKNEDEVQQTLSGLGLKAEIEKGGGLIEDLLPGDPAVCEQDPEAGAQVKRGSRVHVVVSKSC
jgi:hypothetical protein